MLLFNANLKTFSTSQNLYMTIYNQKIRININIQHKKQKPTQLPPQNTASVFQLMTNINKHPHFIGVSFRIKIQTLYQSLRKKVKTYCLLS
jgi:hypothetical protein